MKKIRCILIVFLLIVNYGTIIANVTTIYLSPDGQDSNKGTFEEPLATLMGARNLIRSLATHDTVVVKIASGDYFMTSPLELSTQDATPIIFEGVGDQATFYGGIPIQNWEKVNDQLWRAFIPQVRTSGFSF